MKTYTTASLFSVCSNALQVDGALGFSAAVAEMLVQSQNGEIEFLPALPGSWRTGEIRGLRARGGFEVGVRWSGGRLRQATILSTIGGPCRVRIAPLSVKSLNEMIMWSTPDAGLVEFKTEPGRTYVLTPR